MQTDSSSLDDFFMEEDSKMDLDNPIKDFFYILNAIKNIQQGKVCCLLDIIWFLCLLFFTVTSYLKLLLDFFK